MAADANIYASTMISPLQSVVRFTAAAAGTLFAQGTFVTAFQDQVGQSQSGGSPLWNNDASITGGQVPANQAYEVQGLSCFFALPGAGAAAVPTAIATQALAANLQVQMNYAGQSYQLGRLMNWLGPQGDSVGLSNVNYTNRFGWPWNKDGGGFILEANQSFNLQFWFQANLTAGVVANAVYDLYINMPARFLARGAAAVKQG
jgi:hypothetical protein